MDIKQVLLSRKYATAYLNVFIDQITEQDFYAMKRLTAFLKKERGLLFLFKVPSAHAIKQEAIHILFTRFSAPESLCKLVDLLIDDQRLFLLPSVLYAITEEYKTRVGIEEFAITSSHTLDEQHVKSVVDFLSRKTGKKILHEYSVDKRLIAGVRAQSRFAMWEDSLARTLRFAKQALLL